MTPFVKKTKKAHTHDPIGVFDSGVGGLSTLQHLQRIMPHERFVFLADQSYVPYGEKTGRQLRHRCARVARFLKNKGVKMIVVACNTATCYAIDHLRAHVPLPFVGTVPAIKTACKQSVNGCVAILSTPATTKSEMLKSLILQSAQDCRVVRIGCKGLEEAVEHGAIDSEQTRALIRKYLARARRARADRLVLGCTHYPFLKKAFRDEYAARIVDSAPAVARRTMDLLKQSSLLRTSGTATTSYWTTGDSSRFSEVASLLLGRPIEATKAFV